MTDFKRLIKIVKERGVPVAMLASLAMTGYALAPHSADAEAARTECYQIDGATPFSDIPKVAKETWCYRFEGDGSRFIYNVDKDGTLRPELSIAVRRNGTIRHASLNAGKLTLHNFAAYEGWNPFNLPLDPQKLVGATRVAEPIHAMSADGSDGLTRIMSLVGGVSSNEEDDLPFKATLEEGFFSSKAAYLPWRSFWYPQKSGRLHNGANAPMAKYDKFVEKRIGVSPEAQVWEKRMHPPREVHWAGHCNGWSASSIMRAEPTAPVTDPFSGVTFEISDQKGLWLEADYCPKYVFFGSRNNGNGGDGDIRAVDFHNVVAYYLGNLKKPIIMDLMSNSPVENRVVSGFDMQVRKVKENVYQVATTLSIHSYDNHVSEEVGPAGIFSRTYKYMIEVDDEGRAIKGKWLSRYPDFLWVPLASAECDSKNPVVNEAWLNEIYRLSLRDTTKALLPTYGMMPSEPAQEFVDVRMPGAAPKPNATPPPADRQPDGED